MPSEYKKNFLKLVFFRIDYNKIELGKLEKFYDTELKKRFPFQIEKPGFEGQLEVNFESGNAKHEKTNFIAWEFESKNKAKILHISPKYLFLQYTEYKNSDELFNDLNSIIKKFIESFQIQTINRIGLRYSNEIELNEKSPLDWQSYLQKGLINHINFSIKKKKRVARAMGQLIFKEMDGDLVFNFGIFNKDFPNEIAVKEFILDYDAFSLLPFQVSEENIIERAKLYHCYIKDAFESSITPSFRKLLNK